MTSKCHLYFPPSVAILIIISSYYVYVIGFCVYVIQDLLASCLYIVFLNILFIMFLWSFLSTVATPVARVPLEYQLTLEELENYHRVDNQNKDLLLKTIKSKRNLVLHMCTAQGSIRYCTLCSQIKPDRAHHCSVCGFCVLKMDHHCGWVNNCVGFSNYKSFILMLFYCNMYCIYFTSTTLEYFISYLNAPDKRYLPVVVGFGDILIVIIFVMAAFLGLMGGVFFLFHCGLVFRNETTLEKLQESIFVQQNSSYNLGCFKNFTEVFGKDWRLWLFPVFSAEVIYIAISEKNLTP
ncbi:hypothetical protein NQ318_000503 [Aromia moschata]|uniref:Palmitoyltransferase n=1 Tax=Aromia moschata TaxID=1265417 RepID=A0AAV8YDN1_9CUCU|nr:hypothetical protein NQ318_000503 [Aromia moschata]